MGTKNISLPPDLEGYVDAKVESGEYAHASEVVREGIRLMMQREAEKLEWLRNAIAEGLESMKTKPLIPDDRILEEVEKRGRLLLKQRQQHLKKRR
ncbi:MAG: type II toxin-antitoxin system ParD family antitoxin [Candidatus Eremiobacteraeota bacterium]|nr:type II toxin-antitoxin system ParD family antitoxin [Candidatus Eremiobacteraeota bacterium]MBV8355562.1 type II toxin-antitoxin system ParD family antitoxin [Candidatus Eremiobacteraeota bacterium]